MQLDSVWVKFLRVFSKCQMTGWKINVRQMNSITMHRRRQSSAIFWGPKRRALGVCTRRARVHSMATLRWSRRRPIFGYFFGKFSVLLTGVDGRCTMCGWGARQTADGQRAFLRANTTAATTTTTVSLDKSRLRECNVIGPGPTGGEMQVEVNSTSGTSSTATIIIIIRKN